ncbi:interferon-induced, double-stranded RNA-activated protein kinase-like [Scomber scombrus]|uniref:interferon-induced, double-stranded RNA-activated protein kinase-like n=1 Tax=Scomber scombrus TaxID=13677 RepID=UPI002DDBF0C5|nr:interferon-induced, double-stranded RNA-activated protein kinase-like [Scomber scombrus]
MMEMENYVGKLLEYAHEKCLGVSFEDVGSVVSDHIKTFTVRAVVNGTAYPDGVGKNKKEAERDAAKNALKGLLEEVVDSRETAAADDQPSMANINYTSWLNEYVHQEKVELVESIKLGPNNALQYCRFVVADKEYPVACGKTKREAKEEAAKLVYHEICGSKTTETGDEKSSTPIKQKVDLNQNVSEICDKTKNLSVKTEVKSFVETNFIGIINQYCQKTSRSHTFIEENACGPPHIRQFFYKLVIDNKEYPVGEGKTIKEAKQKAAELAWSALQEQSDWDSKESFYSTVSDDCDPARLSTPSSTLDSLDTASKSTPVITDDSIVFTNTSNPLNVQDQSPDVKPKRKIAPNFQNVNRTESSDFKEKSKGISSIKKTTTPSSLSRFTSDFDSIEPLGKGAFGCVFKAKDKLLHKCYAIKIVRCKEKALREVGALSDLHHHNIVRYYTCWMEDSDYWWDSTDDSYSTSMSTDNPHSKFLYIQMELCDTKTLRVWIDERNTQNVNKSLQDSKRREDSLSLALQIISGVEYVHSSKLIHRDLKPANIMFGRDGEVKIGDFGLVTAENDDNAENLLERTVYKGTPSYMAPEQRNKSTYDRKVDIFALGLIYFELLWNFSTGHERRALWDDARGQKLPQGFSQRFIQESQIIKSMLCVKPEDRPEASTLKTELKEQAHALYPLKNMPRNNNSV